jgi:hypothetical protein
MGKRTDAASTFGSPAALHPLCPANPGQSGCRVRGFPSLSRDKFGLVKSEHMKGTSKKPARSRGWLIEPRNAKHILAVRVQARAEARMLLHFFIPQHSGID